MMLTFHLRTLAQFFIRKRVDFKRVVLPKFYSSDNFCPTSGAERYRHLQRYFNRRVRATCLHFNAVPNYSMVYGLYHVYFIDTNVIYRIDQRQANQSPERLLDLEQFLERDGSGPKTVGQWAVQRIRLSPQERHLAVTLKKYHKEEQRCVIINLGHETLFSLIQPHVIFTLDKVFSFEWATDDVLYFTTIVGLRSSTVFCLDLTKNRKITSVFAEPKLNVFVEVALTRDQKLLTINCNSRSSSEVLVIDKDNLSHEPLMIQRRVPELLYHVEHWKGSLIILTNTGPGQEYQVVQTSLSEPAVDSWMPLYFPPPGFTIKDMEIIEDFGVLITRTPSCQIGLTVMSLNNPDVLYFMELPSWACAFEAKKAGVGGKTNTLEFLISSPVHPPHQFCLLPEEGLVLSAEGNKIYIDQLNTITTSRLEACSKDGTLVPITLFHAAHLKALKEVPLLVHVYGSYGRDHNMEFCPKKRLLLELGWVLAYCHIRGGGEGGLYWHRQARVKGKQKSVEDLVACLQHLFSSGVSSSSVTALTACSAGAVPVGALCNLYPQLIKAVTLQAPFLDVLGTMEDSSLPLTIEDKEEWGDPVGNPSHKRIIASYCPLHNITPQVYYRFFTQRYPSMLITAYSGDSRVSLSGIVKYAEELQKAINSHFTLNQRSECGHKPNIILNIQPGANHHGQEDFDLMVNEDALELAFLYTELGLDPPRHLRKKQSVDVLATM
ncbi:prolyl endopeptidase-like isoform X2 [Boleophthalmus pectinirostris]|uniref:prolyl endopeptidase-like isoform X2 n=1 Tax=Boleophthalmus pectinirostris TaxID=150288 RepID=UPI00242BCE2A|nr:prolyl endopeptidase-like isoform X2 [Boleophthalmus pectinirostris]